MIPALVVPILADPERLYRMLDSLDYPIGRLIVVDNGRVVDRFLLATNRGVSTYVSDLALIELPANLGVAGSWNLGIKSAPFAAYWLIANFDIEWPPGSLERFDRYATASSGDALILSGGQPAWCAFAIGEIVVETVGLFDERFVPAYFEDNDYVDRCGYAECPVVETDIPITHENSSTLRASEHYAERNAISFGANHAFYHDKKSVRDTSSGWSLTRRRGLSWD